MLERTVGEIKVEMYEKWCSILGLLHRRAGEVKNDTDKEEDDNEEQDGDADWEADAAPLGLVGSANEQ